MIRYFTAVLVICCVLIVEGMLLMQCHKATTLQKLIEAEYCKSPFSADFILMVSYLIAVLIVSSIASVVYICICC